MIVFFAPGTPQPKGSARAFVVGKRAIVTNDNPRTKPWAAVVTLAAREAMRGAPALEGPVHVDLTFGLARPKAHSNKYGLRPNAPVLVTTRPDLDKLARTVLDALTMAGVWVDDSHVSSLTARKRYGEPGVRVLVVPGLLLPYREDNVPGTVF